MIWVAAAGVVVNAATAALFLRDRKRDLNIRGAYLHMVADAGVSLGLTLTGWAWFIRLHRELRGRQPVSES